jgi:uracil permease
VILKGFEITIACQKNEIVSVSFQEAALKEGKGQPFIILKKSNKNRGMKRKEAAPVFKPYVMNQISLYFDHPVEEQGREKYYLSKYIGLNLMLDGLNDLINGLFGSTAGTNYGENNSLMVITRNYSGPVLITAGVISMLLGFVGPLADIVTSIPTAVSGGLSIYLFGVIGMQGIALMMSEKVNLFDPRQLGIGAVILIVGIGGNIGYSGGFLPAPILQ